MKNDALGRWGSLFLSLVLFLVLPIGCATADKGKQGEAEKVLQSSMEECTSRYGYDPDKAQSLGEHELGKGEEEWRSCLYVELRKLVVDPTGAVPKLYADLIEQDRRLTEAIKKGEMTRSERKQKNTALVEKIQQDEESRQAAQPKKQQREIEEAMRRKADMEMRAGFQMHRQDALLRAMQK